MSFVDDVINFLNLPTGTVVLFHFDTTGGISNDFGAGGFVSKQVVLPANNFSSLLIIQFYSGTWSGDAARSQVSCSLDIDGTNVGAASNPIRAHGASGLGNSDFGMSSAAIGQIARPQGGTLDVNLNCSLNDSETSGRAGATLIFGIR